MPLSSSYHIQISVIAFFIYKRYRTGRKQAEISKYRALQAYECFILTSINCFTPVFDIFQLPKEKTPVQLPSKLEVRKELHFHPPARVAKAAVPVVMTKMDFKTP